MREQIEALKSRQDIRQNLIKIKEQIQKDDKQKKELEALVEDSLWIELLSHEDAKVRKNTAIILGELAKETMLEALFVAYKNEQQLFVRGSYLKAMQKFDCKEYLDTVKEQYEKLLQEESTRENEKHRTEELFELERLIQKEEGCKMHPFCGYDIESEVILTTDKGYANLTAEQIKNAKAAISATGVRVKTKDLKPIINIRTFREMLFPIHCTEVIKKDIKQVAETLWKSDIWDLLSQHLEGKAPYYFRINILCKMNLREKNSFLKKAAFALEEESRHQLINSKNKYEIEIRLLEDKNGNFKPYLKFYTIPMKRFSYRKNALSVSIQPALSALIIRLASPYLKEDSCVLDPFCGVGTMLIERKKALSVKAMYGVDTFGEAILGARENAELAGENIHYIHRDFFDFTHRDKFDELITNMPARGKKTKEEQDNLYQRFFKKAQQLLSAGSVMVMYTNEAGFVKKQLRLQGKMQLLKEYCIREKDGYYLFIIEVKE